MKTSILVSGFAALCLLVTFAEAPRWNGDNKMIANSSDHISIAAMKKTTMLPGVVITNYRNTGAGVAIPVFPVEDFSYLKFDIIKYLESDAINPDKTGVMPEASEGDYNYLKFNICDYSTDSEFQADKITELPVNEFAYLVFDSNDYLNTSGKESVEIEDLPVVEVNTDKPCETPVLNEATNKFSYLKFDPTKFNSSDNLIICTQVELPEE